ncbi:MAG TPA: histidine kinase N-terminal 7TM domain-containing protein [Cyclobacteriaceae bacterium]|jgi:PAS domain S-box-containing protein|nr:histidine kinase N-terminal 7TM domain-containing protein [Cyclobacteriaceae bacterium]HQQ81612.1 histidine kinase N-terminal 7TM domain-containing protein [Cyclobacteriaceae bacterium]
MDSVNDLIHFNGFSLSLLMSGVASLLIALTILRRGQASIWWFSLMMIAGGLWAIFYALELSAGDLEHMLLWVHFEYIGISFIPAAWVMFVLQFTGKSDWLDTRNLILIWIIPVLTLGMVITNSMHHLHYITTSVELSGAFPLLDFVPGPWYYVHTVYFYLTLLIGMMLLYRHYSQTESVYRRQTRIILMAINIPWIINFLYLIGIRPLGHIDLTPYAFLLTSFIIAYGLTWHELFDIVPFAREQLIENLHEGMLVLDKAGRAVDCNATMRSFFPENSGKIIGSSFTDLFANHGSLAQLLARQSNGHEEFTVTADDGERVYEVSATVLEDDKGVFVGTLLVFWDITRRKKTTEKLEQQTEKLAELNALKNKMFSVIAHDLRSPLASISSLLNLAQSGDLTPDDIHAMMPALSQNVSSTSAMLDNLLHWAKSQLDGEQIKCTYFDFKILALGNTEFFLRPAFLKGVHLINRITEEHKVYADQSMIDLVLRNLISNSIKFCEPGDSIILESESQPDGLLVMVKDSGVGMDAELLSRLFDMNHISRPGTNNEKGTGLGLKLCKDFIEKNRGKLWIKSDPGKGTTVYFRLPVTPSNLAD